MENVCYLSLYFFISDLICGPPPTKSTTTQRTTTRQPEPLPTIVTSVSGSQPDVGQRKNSPRRRNGLAEQKSNAFLNKGRRLIPQVSKKPSPYDSNQSPNPPVKKFNSQSGEHLSNHNI